MAQVITGETLWYTNSEQRAMGPLAIERLSTGQLAVAFGGSTPGGDGIIYTSLLNPGTGKLSAFTENVIPGNSSGGLPVTTVRDIEIDALANGKMVLTYHMANSAVGSDGNFALLTQVYNGRAPSSEPAAVNPDTPADNTYDVFATLTRADGSYVTFFSELGVGGNLSNGIRMASFGADGLPVGPVTQVIGDRVIFPALRLEANPEQVSATFMSNGNIGLVYKENTTTGGSTVIFREITEAGAAVGEPLVLQDGGALLPSVTTVKDGRMLAVWQSVDQFAMITLKAQLLSATGETIGNAFDVSSSPTGTQGGADVVALANGGFAISWFNGFNHAVARIFDAEGKALGHDFSITETSAAFDLTGSAGLVAKGNQLIAYVQGLETGSPQEILAQTYGFDSTVGRTLTGSDAGQTHRGSARDDSISGLGGNDTITAKSGNDILNGGLGNDTISGGAGRDVIRGGAGRDMLTGISGPTSSSSTALRRAAIRYATSAWRKATRSGSTMWASDGRFFRGSSCRSPAFSWPRGRQRTASRPASSSTPPPKS